MDNSAGIANLARPGSRTIHEVPGVDIPAGKADLAFSVQLSGGVWSGFAIFRPRAILEIASARRAGPSRTLAAQAPS